MTDLNSDLNGKYKQAYEFAMNDHLQAKQDLDAAKQEIEELRFKLTEQQVKIEAMDAFNNLLEDRLNMAMVDRTRAIDEHALDTCAARCNPGGRIRETEKGCVCLTSFPVSAGSRSALNAPGTKLLRSAKSIPTAAASSQSTGRTSPATEISEPLLPLDLPQTAYVGLTQKPTHHVPTPTASDHIERRSTSTEVLNFETNKSVSLDRWVKHFRHRRHLRRLPLPGHQCRRKRHGHWRRAQRPMVGVRRIIGEVRPRYVIIENVSALLSGSDPYEFPNDRCLCGWPYRWRGLHQHNSAQQRTDFLRKGGRGDGVEGSAGVGGLKDKIRGQHFSNAPRIGEMGRSESVENFWQTAGSIPDSDIAASAFETGTGGIRAEAASNDNLSAEETEWFRFLDGGGEEERPDHQGASVGIEPQGTAARSIGWMVCEACGRDLDNAATRSGVSTWMGRILWDLASLGLCTEFHSIPASAVGAPHRRDRIWIVAYAQERTERAGLCESNQAGQRRRRLGNGSRPALANAGCEPRQLQATRQLATIEVPQCHSWWRIEPDVGRVAHGIPARVHRLRALGNAVIPQIPELIGRAIIQKPLGNGH